MRTGLTKQEKTTDIQFDKKNPLIRIRTHNADSRKRLTACAGQHPGQYRQTDADPDTGCMEFEIRSGRFSSRLTASHNEERREAARQYAKDSSAADRLKQQVEVSIVLWYILSIVRAANADLMRRIIYITYRLWSENDHLSRVGGNQFPIFLYCSRNKEEVNKYRLKSNQMRITRNPRSSL